MSTAFQILRWMVGIGAIACGFILMADAASVEAPIGEDTERPPYHVLGRSLGGLALIIGGAIMLGPDLAAVISRPFTALIDAIFLPGGKSGRPPADFKLPVFYRKEERYDEALEEYRKIIRYHPEEVEGWIGAIELLVHPFDQTAEARKLYRKARRKFRAAPKSAERLDSAWHRLASSP